MPGGFHSRERLLAEVAAVAVCRVECEGDGAGGGVEVFTADRDHAPVDVVYVANGGLERATPIGDDRRPRRVR